MKTKTKVRMMYGKAMQTKTKVRMYGKAMRIKTTGNQAVCTQWLTASSLIKVGLITFQ